MWTMAEVKSRAERQSAEVLYSAAWQGICPAGNIVVVQRDGFTLASFRCIRSGRDEALLAATARTAFARELMLARLG